MSNETLQSILGSKTVSFYAIFAKAISSVPAAVMLSQAFFWQEECRYKKHLIDLKGKLFFQKTAEEWYEETGLTKEQQLTARKNLRERGILQEELSGMPATTHYRVDIDGLVAVINRYLLERDTVAVKHRNKMRQMPRASSGKFRQQDAVKDGNSYNIESLESKKESKKESAPQAAIRITTHTPAKVENIEVVIVEGQTFDLEEKTNLEPITPAAGNLSAVNIPPDFPNEQYRKPRTPKPAGNSTDPTAETIAYLNEKAGTSFRANSKATKAQINARAKDGYTVEDFKAVIDFKTAEWGADAKMMQYLCPETLFRASKFEGYLQAAKRAGKFAIDTNVARYSLEDRPQAHTPEQMKEELSRFYNANSALLSEAQKTAETNYTGERLKSIVIDFCSKRVANRREGETFGQHHAELGLWLKRQKEFDAAKNSPATTQHTAGPQPQAPLRSAAPVNYSPQGPQLRSEQKAE